MKKKYFACLATVIAVFGYAQMSSASLVNPGFETGDLTGWYVTKTGQLNGVPTNNGEVSAVTSDKGYSPNAGTYFADLVNGSIYASEGIYLSQNLSWLAGDRLLFSYNFWSDDTLIDRAIFSVGVPTHSVYFTALANVNDLPSGSNSTGWQLYEYTFAGSGQGWISFGVENSCDLMVGSRLFVDDVKFVAMSGPGTNPVPEPATMILFGTGLAGFAGVARKKKKS